MARRTLTIKRIDPWSVLKVGFLANLVLLGILLLAGRVVWFFIERLELINRVCEVAEAVAFENCGVNGGNIFRNALLLGLLGVVVQTGILVFGSFLHNLIAELTGGLSMTVVDDTPEVRPAAAQTRTGRPAAATGQAARPAATAGAGAAAGAATSRMGSQASEIRAKTVAETPRPTPGSGGGQPAAPRPAAPAQPSAPSSQPSAPSSQPTAPQQPRPGQPGAGAPGQPGGQPGQPRPSGDPTEVQRRDLFGRDDA